MSRLGGRGRTCNRETVAPREDRDTELPLDAIEMLIALAIEQGQEQVVVELELGPPCGKLAGDGRQLTHAVTASASEPERLLALAAVISAGTISPIRSGAAAICTLWR